MGAEQAPPEPVGGEAPWAVSPATTSGVSTAKVVATMEVPAAHHGRLRPASKKSSVSASWRTRQPEPEGAEYDET